VQGLNSGGMSDASRQALATEVGQIRQGLIGLANTKVQGRPMFGGVTSSGTAYATDGTYTGRGGTAAEAATPITRRTSDTSTVRVDITGPEAFGDASTGDDDLFAVVDKIATALTPDPANPTDPAAELTSQLSALDGAITRLTTARTDVGTRAARLDDAAQLQQDRGLTLTSRLSAVEDIDMPKVIMDLQQQQVGYQAALAATAKAIPNSLVDYLR
jgi:flagellar hook-associated protein 3 FlgL